MTRRAQAASGVGDACHLFQRADAVLVACHIGGEQHHQMGQPVKAGIGFVKSFVNRGKTGTHFIAHFAHLAAHFLQQPHCMVLSVFRHRLRLSGMT